MPLAGNIAASPQRYLEDVEFAQAPPARRASIYNGSMQKKIFWTAFTILGLVADMVLPLWWAVAATLPIGYLSWWVAYRSDWF
ncbi:MAG: hypothetical protein WCA00_17155 [Candidatus Acidiferrales bacterium]